MRMQVYWFDPLSFSPKADSPPPPWTVAIGLQHLGPLWATNRIEFDLTRARKGPPEVLHIPFKEDT